MEQAIGLQPISVRDEAGADSLGEAVEAEYRLLKQTRQGEQCYMMILTSQGGHFAALENPLALWSDVYEFIKMVWK